MSSTYLGTQHIMDNDTNKHMIYSTISLQIVIPTELEIETNTLYNVPSVPRARNSNEPLFQW